MPRRNKWVILIALLLSLMLVVFGCGGGSGSSSDDASDTDGGDTDTGGGGDSTPSGLNDADSVTGTVRSASGDPIAGATVYIPGTQVAAQLVRASRANYRALTATDGTTCEDPAVSDSSLAAACSAADGSFIIDTSSVSANADQIVFQKGALRMVQDLECEADPCDLDKGTTTFSGNATWPKIAVVTGNYDRIEGVLAKLADADTSDSSNGSYGRVSNFTGMFVYGSEYGTNLTIIDGTGYSSPAENSDLIGSYNTWSSYFDGTNALVVGGVPVFDIIFINCGNNSEYELFDSSDTATQLKAYVNAGGRLYVTDQAYDYVEQVFPQVMRFEGEADDPETPGDLDAAEDGTDGVNLNAVVNNTDFKNWLKTVSVNQHDASTPGNPDVDCKDFGEFEYPQFTGALTSSDLIPIGDFLSAWARMVGAHTGQSPTIWISSGSGVTFDGQENRPLTISQSIGSNGGLVIYSSYHTADNCPTLTFWPQERVLQYLIFEAF